MVFNQAAMYTDVCDAWPVPPEDNWRRSYIGHNILLCMPA